MSENTNLKRRTIIRISADEQNLEIAKIVSKRSICVTRHQVGAVITKDNQIISTGYNGSPKGFSHCEEGCVKDRDGTPSGKYHPECLGVHAEMNALIQAGRLAKGGTMYVTNFPCRDCAKLIINAGIIRVVVDNSYPDEEGLKYLRMANIEISFPNGVIVR